MSNLLFASVSLTAALLFGSSLTEAPQVDPIVEAIALEENVPTPIGKSFSASSECDFITIYNFTGTTHYFQIGADCNGDGEYDGIMDETFVPLRLDERGHPSSQQVRRKWWWPCRFTHLIYAGPSGGVGSPGIVTRTGLCTFEIHPANSVEE